MRLRARGRYSNAKRGELDKVCAPFTSTFFGSRSLRPVLEAAAGSAAQVPCSPCKGDQRQDAEEGWKHVRHSKTASVDANQPVPRDKLQQDGWSVKVEHTLSFHRAKEWVFMASTKEAKVLMAETHSDGSLAVLAPINERGAEISVLVQDRNGCVQSWQRFLRQLGAIPVQYQSTAPQGGSVKDGGTKQIVLSLSKQYTQTNRVGKQRNWHRESRRADGCNAELVWKCSTCVLRRAVLDAKNCKLWPRLPARQTKVHCGPAEWTA